MGTTCREVATAMDFLPTFARLGGTDAPSDRIVDGKDIRPLMCGESGATSPHDAFFYFRDGLEAVRSGPWKRHVRKGNQEMRGLYDLATDICETTNVADRHPSVVRDLEAKLAACRKDLGDSAVGMAGANCRPIGRVSNPAPLTRYDPNHPYIIAMYDLEDAG